MQEFNERLKKIVRGVLERLAEEDYEALVMDQRMSGCRSGDLRRVVREYGRRIVSPPDTALDRMEIYETRSGIEYTIEVDLHTLEEGRSDLTLTLGVLVSNDFIRVGVSDLRVM